MSVIETIEAVRSGLMWIGLWTLGLCLVALLGCAISEKRHSCLLPWSRQARPSPVESGESAASPRPSRSVLVGIALLAIVCTLFGGGKMRSGGGRGATALPGVTAEEIAQGWRLESVVTNDAVSYAMPTNGVEYAPWSLGGGYMMHFPLDLGDFAFPFGTGVVRRLDVVSGGLVESLPRQRMEGAYHSLMSICAAREWASIVPGVGRFWWADAARPESAPYRGKVLTWENVYAGRDRTGQYNAQIELCGDGNFITRSNDVERVYRRVLPFDLDNDGLPNDIDPAPETPIVPSAWNQSEAWAAAAFPSNAAEIAAMGGYAAWAAARGANPDRRLVSLGVVFDDGSVRPTLLDFGGVPVVADGAAELVFAIDCGAKVPFSLTSGRLGSLAVTATEPPTRSGEGMTTTESSVIQNMSAYPHERMVGDVRLHLDSPRSGWLCRAAGVSVVPTSLPHFFPNDTVGLEATVSDCHSNAYLGCTWTGGAGITFSQEHSLSTTVTYDPDEPDIWSTNGIDLITQFVGYSLTNHVHFTVGTTNEPNTEFSISCPDVMFLNDLSNGKRAERVYSVSLTLSGPHGTGGHVSITSISGAELRLFYDDALSMPATNAIPFYLPEDGLYETTTNLYLACTTLGNGMLRAEIALDGGGTKSDTSICRVIEPLRRFVMTEQASDGRFFNPSCLVWGTNAALKVAVNTGTASFSPEEIRWSVVSGPGMVFPTNGLQTVLTPTADNGTVVVEARFNDDEIQPRFTLPIVRPMTINVRAFVVRPPKVEDFVHNAEGLYSPWTDEDVESRLTIANKVFTQVGVKFSLVGIEHGAGSADDWIIRETESVIDANGRTNIVVSSQARALFSLSSTNAPEVAMFFLGDIISRKNATAFNYHKWIVVGRKASEDASAHELGHALGLGDCYVWTAAGELIVDGDKPVKRGDFSTSGQDWWRESGRGFYSIADGLETIAGQMLMYGEDTADGCDIPGQWFNSLRQDTVLEGDKVHAPVGAEYIKRNPEEVYNR